MHIFADERGFYCFTVFLNGAVVDRVISACDQSGVVVVWTPVAPGDREPRRLCLRGQVEIARHAGGRWPEFSRAAMVITKTRSSMRTRRAA